MSDSLMPTMSEAYQDDATQLKVTATLESGDIEIGGVEIKNGTDDTRAKVAATGSVAEGDNALAVQAPVLGITTGAAVTTNANGTLQQYLRGLVTLFIAEDFATQTTLASVLAVAGATTGAAVTTNADGTIQQYLRGLVTLFIAEDFATQTTLAAVLATAGATNGAAVVSDGDGTLQQYLRGIAKNSPFVANAPVDAAGKAVDVNTTVRIDGTTDLVAGARYIVEVWPDIAAGAAATDVIWGWIKSATSVGSQGDGVRIATGYPREVRPITGKLNLSFMRDSNTAFACRVYVNRIDA